jgi:hypothetical protein
MITAVELARRMKGTMRAATSLAESRSPGDPFRAD